MFPPVMEYSTFTFHQGFKCVFIAFIMAMDVTPGAYSNMADISRLSFDPVPTSIQCQAAARKIWSLSEHEGWCLALSKPPLCSLSEQQDPAGAQGHAAQTEQSQ